MSAFKKLFFIGICIFLNSCLKEKQAALLISNITIIDIETGSLLSNKDIWIEGERINKIEDHDPTRKSLQFLDGTNQFVIPSLWDMHAHIVDYSWVPDLYTSLGVTGLRVMHGDSSRMNDILLNRKDGFYKGFEFLYSSPITDGPGDNWPGTEIASSPEEGRSLVQKYVETGYDFVKIYHHLDHETYLAIVDECKKLDIPFAGHVPNMLTTQEVIKTGQKSIEHWLGLEHALPDPSFMETQFSNYDTYAHFLNDFLERYDSSLIEKVLDVTKSDQTWFCPTLITTKNSAYSIAYDSIFRHDERLKFIPSEEQEYWFGDLTEDETPAYLQIPEEYNQAEIAFFKLHMTILKKMLDNGSKFLAGTDTSSPNVYPGFSLHEELQLFVEAGFTELEALQTATLNPAIFAQRENDLGTIEQGKIANLLILDQNPLVNIENTLTIDGLIRRGKYFDKETLESLRNLEEITSN